MKTPLILLLHGFAGGNATLNGWSLTIKVVPEPENRALGALGRLSDDGIGLRRLWRSKGAKVL